MERFYDRSSRSSVTRVIDAEGNQIGDADYSGDQISANYVRTIMIRDNGGAASKGKRKRTSKPPLPTPSDTELAEVIFRGLMPNCDKLNLLESARIESGFIFKYENAGCVRVVRVCVEELKWVAGPLKNNFSTPAWDAHYNQVSPSHGYIRK